VSDGLVDTSALTSRDGSVVDDRDGAPTAIVRSSYARLAIRVLHARIIDRLEEISLLENRDLSRNQFKDLLRVPFANASVEALHENKHVTVRHRPVKIIGSRSSRGTKSHGVSHYLRGIDRNIDSLDGSLRTFVDPELVLEIFNGTLGPDRSVGFPDGGHVGGEGSIPFTLNVSLVDLQTTVISDNGSGSVVVGLASLFALVLGGTSTVRGRNASSVRGTSI
jgi:hypothetical protein